LKILVAAGRVSITLAAVLLVLTSCKPAGLIYNEKGEIECGGNGKAIILTNNPKATDPTFDKLAAFIEADTTDAKDYVKAGSNAFVCSDFAEEVHNNAEAAGIRAAWVGLTFNGTDEGHALNAFETTDKGLIYIDCTNGKGSEETEGQVKSWDSVAYIETGSKYGVIPLDRVVSSGYSYYPLEYDYYAKYDTGWQDYRKQLKAYNDDVDRFNRETSGKVYTIGSSEARRITDWQNTLLRQKEEVKNREKELGDYWYESEYSSYTVKSVKVHW
jgi:hypothetical protein